MRNQIAFAGLVLGFLSTACVDSSSTAPCVDPSAAAAKTTAVESSSGAVAATTDVAAGVAPKKCSGPAKPAPDGLIDDFEDGDTRVAMLGGRDGYWWTAYDPSGSTIEPDKFASSSGGASSARAAHFKGTTSSAPGAWGATFGANFRSEQAPYDASQFAGISFKAKVGPNSSKNVRFKIGDINTHEDAGVCKACWNHFGADVTLTEQWQEYQILFADTKQADGWGQPRPAALTTDKLWNIDFSVGPGVTYDIWVDDVQLLTCP